MTENKYAEELIQSRAEIARLKEQMAEMIPTRSKDLSLISIIPKWSGAETAAPL
jgi:hypothetical protein